MLTPSMQRMADPQQAFIVRYFEDFYQEIIALKRRIETIPSSSSPTDDNTPLNAAQIISHLKTYLEQQALTVNRQGGDFVSHYYQEAQYIMAVLADEVFLNMDWPGRVYWEDYLLESQLFGSHDAGDLFFQRLDEFLHTRDPARHDLAEIYLLALGLGFQGRYRGQHSQNRLAQYKHDLYMFIHHHELTFFNDHERLFPQAYAHTLEARSSQALQDTRRWYGVFALGALVIFIVTHIFWRQAVSEITTLVDNIETHRRP